MDIVKTILKQTTKAIIWKTATNILKKVKYTAYR